MHYDEFLDCARRFVQRSRPAEVDLRNCASRAYYYLFHKIRETFRNDKSSDFENGPSDHQKAVEFFRTIRETTLANRVHHCYNIRKNADYDINRPFRRIQANEQLREVVSIARQIDVLSSIRRP